MKVTATLATSWQRVVNAARRTVGKGSIDHDPKHEWRKKILISEHSPIRLLEFDLLIEEIRQWVSVHYVRHHIGVEKFVHSQREDRRKLDVPRDELPQGAENDMQYTCNAQALINISRKRLCLGQPSPETRAVWEEVKRKIEEQDKEMASVMVKECVYRGFCPEDKCCGYCFSKAFEKEVEEYRSGTTWSKMK